MTTIKTDGLFFLIENDGFEFYAIYPPNSNFDEDTKPASLRTHSANSKEELLEHLKGTFSNVFTSGNFIIELRKKSNSHGAGCSRFMVNLNSYSIPGPTQTTIVGNANTGMAGLSNVQEFEEFRKRIENDVEARQSQFFEQKMQEMEFRNKIMQKDNLIEELKAKLRAAEEDIRALEKDLDFLEKNKNDLSDKYGAIAATALTQVARNVPQLQGLFEQSVEDAQVVDESDTVEL